MPVGTVGGPRFITQPTAGVEAPPARFELAGQSQVRTKEASDIVSLPQGGFIVVGDLSSSAEMISPTGESTHFKLEGVKKKSSGLEAVAFDPAQGNLFVSSEEDRKLLRYKLTAGKNKPTATLEKEFEIPMGGRANKGVEGMAFLPGPSSPTGMPQLLIAKEGDPKTLALLAADGSGAPRNIELDPKLDSVCADISAVAVDPKSGRVFLASDESSSLAELRLKQVGNTLKAELVQATPLVDSNGKPLERVEGITFDRQGNLFVLLENDGSLLEMKRKG